MLSLSVENRSRPNFQSFKASTWDLRSLISALAIKSCSLIFGSSMVESLGWATLASLSSLPVSVGCLLNIIFTILGHLGVVQISLV